MSNRRLIVILGPTASGKSELAVKIAKKFNGEIISADSRQIYKGMDIGTGKITKREMRGIPHYLLDVVSPKKRFTVVQYRKLALEAIDKIFKKGRNSHGSVRIPRGRAERGRGLGYSHAKIPILCGGTGFYIQAVVDGIIIPEVPPDWKLRKKLEKKSVEELYKILKKLDPKRAKTIETKNPRRLIRAIEIVKKIGRVPILKKKPLPYPVLMIGIKREKEELRKLIKKRFLDWLKKGLIKEVENLKKSGLSWKKIEDFGIHYRVIAQYLQNKLSYQEMVENSLKELQNYAKRQMTWFKRDKRIIWVKNQKEVEELVKKFLEN
jgi:tRNA dimethylallyltransferase